MKLLNKNNSLEKILIHKLGGNSIEEIFSHRTKNSISKLKNIGIPISMKKRLILIPIQQLTIII